MPLGTGPYNHPMVMAEEAPSVANRGKNAPNPGTLLPVLFLLLLLHLHQIPRPHLDSPIRASRASRRKFSIMSRSTSWCRCRRKRRIRNSRPCGKLPISFLSPQRLGRRTLRLGLGRRFKIFGRARMLGVTSSSSLPCSSRLLISTAGLIVLIGRSPDSAPQ